MTTMLVLNPKYIPLSLGATPENFDSWSDDAKGDLSSTGPSPSGTSSSETSAGKKKMGRFRRTNKAKGESSSDKTSQNASNSLERVINVKNCPLCHCTPKLRLILLPI